MRATIVDIKNRTGLSLATISKYLNGGNVRPENREKIEEAIDALHYQVNESARSLVTNRSRMIGVIAFSIENLFVAKMVHHMGEYLSQHGYSMLICDSNFDREQELANVRSMVQKNVDGILLMPCFDNPKLLEIARNAQVPIVCVDRRITDPGCDSVLLDNRTAARQLTELLLRNDHKRIAVIGSLKEYTGQMRFYGYRDAMEAVGLSIPQEYLCLGEHSLSWGYQCTKKLLSMPNRPTAILSSNYEITLGSIMAIHESPYSYPQDFSLVAFDNLLLSDVVQPRITVAIQPLEEIASAAAELILRRIDEKLKDLHMSPESIVLEARITEFDSVSRCKE